MKKTIAFIFLIAVLLTGCAKGQAASSLPETKSIEDISSAPSSTVSTAASSEPEISSEISSEPVTSSAPDAPLSDHDKLLEEFKSGDIPIDLIDIDYPEPEFLKEVCSVVGKGNRLEWLQYDINHDGLDDLVLQEQEILDDGTQRIFGIFSAESRKIRRRLWDENDSTEYCFVAPNGNIIYFYIEFGDYGYVAYELYEFDAEWNRQSVYEISVYDVHDPINEEEWKDRHPEMNKKGTYYTKTTFETADDGAKIRKEESITKEQFFELFLEMTGASFYDMIPAGIKLRDEVK